MTTDTSNNGHAAEADDADDRVERKPIPAAEQKKLLASLAEVSEKLAKNGEVRAQLKAKERTVLMTIFGAIGPSKFRLPTGEVVSIMKRRPKGGGEPMFVLRGKGEDEIADFGA